MSEPNDIEALRAQARRHARHGILAQSRGAGRHARVQGIPAPRVPAERLGVARSRRPPRLPEADAASLALAGVSACTRQPTEELVPYVRQPEELVPGKPLFYATAMPFAGAGMGLLVESHEGRPDQDRGQPGSPVEPRRHRHLRAGVDPRPLRSRPLARRSPTSARSSRSAPSSCAMRSVLAAQQSKQGAGLRILTETVASPTLAAQIDELLARLPAGEVGAVGAVRRPQRPRGQPPGVRRVRRRRSTRSTRPTSSCRSTPTSCAPAPPGLRHARAFASRRRAEGDRAQRNRLYAVESTPTNTGSQAPTTACRSRRRRSRGSRGPLAAQLDVPASPARRCRADAARRGSARCRGSAGRARHEPGGRRRRRSRRRCTRSCTRSTRRSATSAPRSTTRRRRKRARQPARRPARAGRRDERRHGGLPADPRRQPGLHRAGRSEVRRRARQGARCARTSGQYEDETAEQCHWHIPEAHYLEMWSDVRADDGTVTIVQPLIAPLYGGKSPHEMLAALAESGGERPGYDIVREYWARQTGLSTAAPAAPPVAVATPAPAPATPQAPPGGAAAGRPPARRPATGRGRAQAGAVAVRLAWRKWLHDGLVPDTAFAPKHGDAAGRDAGGDARRRRRASRSCSGPIPRSTTAASRTTPGCRSCPSRSPS